MPDRWWSSANARAILVILLIAAITSGACGNSGTGSGRTGAAGAAVGGASATGGGGAGGGGAGTAGGNSTTGAGMGGEAGVAVGGSIGVGGSVGNAGAGGRAAGGQPGTAGQAGGGGGAGGGARGGAGGGAGQISTGGTSGGNPWITFDAPTVVARSNVVLAHANAAANQFMPVGNGKLGAAVWAAGGFTAQLNRVDTFPDRKSPGWLTIPGLAQLTGAADFKGTLDLYNAMLIESGGGMTAKIFVRADSDELVVDVTGADPNAMQTASVALWSGRSPQAQAAGAIATLSETWLDSNTSLGGSNQRFGSLAALTAGGRNVQASANGATIAVSFQPNADGSFRVICGAPSYNGAAAAATAASALLGNDASAASLQASHTNWWHSYWGRIGLVKMSSGDGAADYFENIRTMYLYISASQFRGAYPGSQAGVGDLFSFSQDAHQWVPQDFWFWNLRMQVAANLTSGAFEMNAPIFNLYTSNVANMQAWTKARMGNRAGICLPETMRFNGNGWYGYAGNQSCDQTVMPAQWNSLTITSGAEVALWIWQQYQATGDKAFLQANYPVMSNAAQFLLAYASEGSDGLLHTTANAHETQWNVKDPITDIAAMRALFPVVIAAAQALATDASLVSQLQAAIPKIPDYPRYNMARTQVLTASSDAGGSDILAYSAEPTNTTAGQTHNVENLGLEPVWPYNLVSDTDATLFALAKRSYTTRQFNGGTACNTDWTNDPIHAARLGLAGEVATTMTNGIACYQAFPSGFAILASSYTKEPYVEQMGVFAAAINEALAQDFDGVVRVAPALPAAWSVAGTVFIAGQSKLDVQYQGGAVQFAVLEAGASGTINVRNPWSGTMAAVVDNTGQELIAPTAAATLAIAAQAGRAYLIRRASDANPTAVQVTGTPATAVKKLGARTIGVP